MAGCKGTFQWQLVAYSEVPGEIHQWYIARTLSDESCAFNSETSGSLEVIAEGGSSPRKSGGILS